MDSPSEARSRVVSMRSDCTHIFGLLVNPSLGSGPDAHSRSWSSSEKRPLMASPASWIYRISLILLNDRYRKRFAAPVHADLSS